MSFTENSSLSVFQSISGSALMTLLSQYPKWRQLSENINSIILLKPNVAGLRTLPAPVPCRGFCAPVIYGVHVLRIDYASIILRILRFWLRLFQRCTWFGVIWSVYMLDVLSPTDSCVSQVVREGDSRVSPALVLVNYLLLPTFPDKQIFIPCERRSLLSSLVNKSRICYGFKHRRV